MMWKILMSQITHIVKFPYHHGCVCFCKEIFPAQWLVCSSGFIRKEHWNSPFLSKDMVEGLCGCWFLIAWLSHKKITCLYCLAIFLLKTNLDMGGIFSNLVNDFICMTAFNVFAMWNFAVTNLENLTSLSAIEEVKYRQCIQQRFSIQKV